MNFQAFVLYLIYTKSLIILNLMDKISCQCQFPGFLQGKNPWTATYTNDGQLTAYFKSDLIEANFCPSNGKKCFKYERKCLKEIESGKFLVEHRERSYMFDDRGPDFLCIQFLQRSEHIIQLRTSHTLPHQSLGLCREDNLILDKWPIISPSLMKSPSIPCPFSGGYNMRIRGPEGELCPRRVILPRMESECEGGDGIHFDFRYMECIHSNLKMSVKQRVECVAEWTQGPYTFVILRPGTGFEAWCMRLTQPLHNLERAYLFMDLVCDPGDGNAHGQIKATNNYLTLNFNRITIPSVCANEFEGCTDLRFCGTEMNSYCHRSCNRCKSEVDVCPFPEDIQGQFLHVTKNDTKILYVTVTPYQLTWPNIGKFKCLPMKNPKYRNKTVLLHTFDNGCFPRFACMETYRSSTSVRQFRLGNRVNWPIFPLSDAEKQACQPNRFRIQVPDGDSTRTVSMPRTTVIQTQKHYYSIDCKLPETFGFGEMPLYFREGNKCDGCISSDSSFKDRITVRPLNCSTVERRRIEYVCLASFSFDNVTQAVITGTQQNNALREFLCWIFTGTGSSRKIVVLSPADCNRLSLEMVLEQQLVPIAKFQILDPPPKFCPYIIDTIPPPDPPRDPSNVTSTTKQTTTSIKRQKPNNPGYYTNDENGSDSYSINMTLIFCAVNVLIIAFSR